MCKGKCVFVKQTTQVVPSRAPVSMIVVYVGIDLLAGSSAHRPSLKYYVDIGFVEMKCALYSVTI